MGTPSPFEIRTHLLAIALIRISGWIALGVAFCAVGAHVDSFFAVAIGWSLVLCLALYVGLRVDALVVYLGSRDPAGPYDWKRKTRIALVGVIVGLNTGVLAQDVTRALTTTRVASASSAPSPVHW